MEGNSSWKPRSKRVLQTVSGHLMEHTLKWEGSATDSRVLRDALTRNDPFIVPKDKYFLVDAGYTNGPGFLAPYRGIQYHLNEWSTRGNNPQNPKELYNPRHATARNVI
ncbi:uncharacterized protein LOC121802633 [Salvia splendens]|uniref:uncharacterized protein LOC121802633 n=1 Tax=Salvia splendens TaxID=180675 RepID=UPI001C267B0B|nr:uncharacterized protein LOC121802633 [Salvia splendens]